MWFALELRQSGQLTGNVTIDDDREKMASCMYDQFVFPRPSKLRAHCNYNRADGLPIWSRNRAKEEDSFKTGRDVINNSL